MGIKTFSKFLTKNKRYYCQEVSVKDLNGKRIAIDASYDVYRYSYKFNNPLLSIIDDIVMFEKHNITPIYVFDGQSSENKSEEVQKRNEQRKALISDFNDQIDATDNEIFEKLDIFMDPNEKYSSLMELLENFGIEYKISCFESDSVLANLEKNGEVDYVLTQDSDMFAFGVKNWITRIRKHKFKKIFVDKIIEDYNLDDLRHVAYYCGCDYNKKTMTFEKSVDLIKSGNFDRIEDHLFVCEEEKHSVKSEKKNIQNIKEILEKFHQKRMELASKYISDDIFIEVVENSESERIDKKISLLG